MNLLKKKTYEDVVIRYVEPSIDDVRQSETASMKRKEEEEDRVVEYIDGELRGYHVLARTIRSIDGLKMDEDDMVYPHDIEERVLFLRALPVSFVSVLFDCVNGFDLSKEEERQA